MNPNKKNLAIMTMVRDDHHWAKLWLNHYALQVESKKDLYVIIHGNDKYLEAIFSGCSVINVPLREGGLENFERKRLDFEHFFIRGLQAYFRCVLLVDIDEFVIVSPEIKKQLWEYLSDAHQGEMVRSAIGFEVVDRNKEANSEINFNKPVLFQRQWVYCNAQYSKTCAFFFNFGGATHHRVWGAPWIVDPHLILFHLRYCDKGLIKNYVTSRKRIYNEQSETGAATSGSWKAPWKEYINTVREVQQLAEGILDEQTRHDPRRKLLEHFVKTNRIGKVSSGFLLLPEEYWSLF